jgi:hypothetical protein
MLGKISRATASEKKKNKKIASLANEKDDDEKGSEDDRLALIAGGFTQSKDSPWSFVVDSGCTHHMIQVSSLLKNKRDYNGVVKIANRQEMRITAVGKLDVQCFSTKRRILIEDVYVVPNIVCSLLWVKALCRKRDCDCLC